ncbi:hypothetical protein TNCV_4353031 [Trichonephila clavipes]|nr:hypothetical protein TNCV_4353031 [Trichonephila clavipes]
MPPSVRAPFKREGTGEEGRTHAQKRENQNLERINHFVTDREKAAFPRQIVSEQYSSLSPAPRSSLVSRDSCNFQKKKKYLY